MKGFLSYYICVLGILYRVGVVLLRSAAVSPFHDNRQWRPLPSSPVVPPWTPWRLSMAAWLRGRKRGARSGRDGVKTFKTRRRPSKTLWVPAAKPMSLLKKCCCLTSLHVMSQQIQYQRLIIMNKTVKTLLVRWDYSLRKWNVVKVMYKIYVRIIQTFGVSTAFHSLNSLNKTLIEFLHQLLRGTISWVCWSLNIWISRSSLNSHQIAPTFYCAIRTILDKM